MFNKQKKNISISLILILFFTRVFFFVPCVYGADLTVPSVPSVPSFPSSSGGHHTPSEVPSVPTVPAVPTMAPQGTQSSSNPTASSVSPTVVSSSPTNSPEPTGNTTQTTEVTPTGTSGDSSGTSSSDNSQTGESESTGGSEGTDNSTGNTTSSVNDPANTQTGAGSQNYASETLDQKMETLNKNLAELQNKIDAISNSGFNYANLNTLDGQVFTGDTVASLNLLNKLNSNMTGLGGFSVFNVYDTQYGDIVFKFAGDSSSFASASPNVSKNATTGPYSENEAIADSSFTVKEAYGNDATIENDINLQAVTGNNTASYNTGNGSVTTGDATAIGNIINLANTNLNVSQWLIGVVNVFGTLAGNIILPKNNSASSNTTAQSSVLVDNQNTGSLSLNDASYTVNNTSSTTMDNSADVTSTLNVTANSGNNAASVNTGGGSVTTGSTDASVSNSTIANTNTVDEDGTVWMIIVNKMGKWVGEIVGNPWGSTAASNALPISQTGSGSGNQNYSTTSQNSNTGYLSDNDATYNSTVNSTTTVENKASISNNITANADTGNNKAEYNTGAGEIETGDAKSGVALVNMVNTNVVAKKFVAVIVNVLGEFVGNVISPDQKSSVADAGNTTSNSTNTNNANTTTAQPTPTPTVYQLAQFTTVANNIGGLTSSDSNTSFTQVINQAQENADISYQASLNDYQQAVSRVQNTKNQLFYKSKQLTQRFPETYILGSPKTNTLKRGSFVSPAFAKAVEGSFPGILLGGATWKVNESWLWIVPFALLFIYIRRRKKINIDFGKYLNALLEVVL
jgi:hypothetical protein